MFAKIGLVKDFDGDLQLGRLMPSMNDTSKPSFSNGYPYPVVFRGVCIIGIIAVRIILVGLCCHNITSTSSSLVVVALLCFIKLEDFGNHKKIRKMNLDAHKNKLEL